LAIQRDSSRETSEAPKPQTAQMTSRPPWFPASPRTPSWPRTASTIETITMMAMFVRTKRKTRFTTTGLLAEERDRQRPVPDDSV
jgi:hypothetical protein